MSKQHYLAFVSEIHKRLKSIVYNQDSATIKDGYFNNQAEMKHQASVVYEAASDLPIYERNQAWEVSKALKLEQARLSEEMTKEQFPFKPVITRMHNPSGLFTPHMQFSEEQARPYELPIAQVSHGMKRSNSATRLG